MKKRHSIICASYALLLRGNEVLLLRRFNTGYEDGKYSVPAGHVDDGESILQALVREVKEEIGVDIDKKDAILAHTMHRKAGEDNDERIDFFFICTIWKGEVQNSEPHKCDDLSWIDLDALPENVIPYIKAGIDNSTKRLSYSDIGW